MLLTCGLAVRAFAGGLLGVPVEDRVTIEPVVIDVNRAGLAELQALPGIGPTRAEAIILHRLRHGPFRCVDDLTRVDGLGATTVEALRSAVRL
ncbi:MAG: helix-hairpin-helix domain-containing protein [Planctomycetes bacterium]|nr:helix-hairpin-helix domain-containing protein [Planctomycetota bacterium]